MVNRRDFMTVSGAAIVAPSLPAAELKPGDIITLASRMVKNPLGKIWNGDLLRIEHGDGSFSTHVATENVEQGEYIESQVTIHPAIRTPVFGSQWGHPCLRIGFRMAVQARNAYAAEMNRLLVTPTALARMELLGYQTRIGNQWTGIAADSHHGRFYAKTKP